MGQFSWLDCKTGEQVIDDKRRDVYVLIPKEFGGGHIKEECYDGYGRFGGHDVYDLVVDWNINHLEQVYANEDTWKCEWIKTPLTHEDFERVKAGEMPVQEKRHLGIALACYDKDNERLHYPIKITHDPNAVYEECSPSMSDPNQGWEFNEDDEDDEWY